LIVNRPHLCRIVGTLSLASTHDLMRAEAAFVEPMQCKPVTALPADEKWTFEIKFDGYRCI
jgi:ATP-dependent DNA ligase